MGPFLAKKTENRCNYRIKDKDGNNKVVHLDQLNEYFNEEPLAIIPCKFWQHANTVQVISARKASKTPEIEKKCKLSSQRRHQWIQKA